MVCAPETMNSFANFSDRRLCSGESAVSAAELRCVVPAAEHPGCPFMLAIFSISSPHCGVPTRPRRCTRSTRGTARSRRCLTLHSDGEEHHEEDRPFPASPPILGLLSPLDLPIWGGETSFYQPLATERLSPARVKITFGHREEAAEFGHVIIDLDDGIAEDLLINGIHYVRASGA
ncbi:hypothetical protein [Brevibacterium otitidis]|uniref:hypothetical protein n=2 Tax=Brevibacterium otitidis TaxID=53364 RepID=UPI00366D1876